MSCFRFLEKNGYFDNTMIVFTSDHGDYLGDHWLGEKELFHEPSVKIPLIIYDPSNAADVDARDDSAMSWSRRSILRRHFLKRLAAIRPISRTGLEGRSLMPMLRGKTA